MKRFINKLRQLLPDSQDNDSTRFFKIMIYVSTGLFFFMMISGIIAFMAVTSGSEEVMIPDVAGMKLEDALITMQERGLNSRINLRFSDSPLDKGNVVEQEPRPGSIKKAGSKVVLRVSKGSIIDTIENYIGWEMQDLEAYLRTLFNTYGSLLDIKEPVIEIYSDQPAGTILEQKPLPETMLTGPTKLELVVSRGAENGVYTVPIFETLDFNAAMKKAAGFNLPFLFSQAKPKKNDKSGVVIQQRPERGIDVPHGTIVQLVTTPPKPEEGKIFGILEISLPDYPVSVNIELQKILPDSGGLWETVFIMRHRGGPIAIPYFEENGTTLIIKALDQEIVKFKIEQ